MLCRIFDDIAQLSDPWVVTDSHALIRRRGSLLNQVIDKSDAVDHEEAKAEAEYSGQATEGKVSAREPRGRESRRQSKEGAHEHHAAD